MTRVGIDLRIVHYAKTGFARYARGLIRSLERFPQNGTRFVLLRHADDDGLDAMSSNIEETRLATPVFCPEERERLHDEITPLALDAVHFPFSLFPGRVTERVILTVHDLTCLKFPQSIEERYLPFYLGALRRAGEADRILAVSDRVACELAATGLPARNIRPCYQLTPFEEPKLYREGAVDRVLAERLNGRCYLLSVGSLEPRKNQLALLNAFGRLRQRADDRVLLVLVGSHGWLMEPLLNAIDNHPARSDIYLVRDANDATLRHLFRHCRLYVNCSAYEGFGLPALEALAEGACVLSTPIPSLVESGFPADGFIDTDDVDALARRLATLLVNVGARDALAARSHTIVGRFYRSLDPERLARMYDL